MMNSSFLSNIDGKNAVLKQQILGLCINDGDYSIADNSAYAMGVSGITGSITPGKKANLIITESVPSLAFIPYSHQTPFIRHHILNGKIWNKA